MNYITIILSIAGIAGIITLIIWNHLVSIVIVHQHHAALLFRHGKLLRQLTAGRHRLFGSGHQVITYDTRWTDMAVLGQEFLTADKAGIKVSANVRYRITNALRFNESAESPLTILYVSAQLALRDAVGGRDLEKVLDRGTSLTKELTDALQSDAEALGLEVQTVAIKDLTVSGDIRRVYTEALTARQQSLITLEKARAEAAAMRTLANGARVFETHPALLQLKFLQTLERAEGGIAQPLALGTAGQWLDFLRK